jgi:AraC-like DNA-binding protein
VFVLQYNYNDYEVLLHEIAEQFKLVPQNNTIHFPEPIGSGYLSCVKLPNGLQLNISNSILKQDWWIHRIKSEEEFYTLRFDELEIPNEMTIAINREEKHQGKKTFASAYLTSSLFDWYYIGSKGVHFRGVNILFSKEWMAKYLGLSNDEVITTYLSLKADRLELEPLDSEYRLLMDEIINNNPNEPFPVLSMQNKTLALMERFFSRLYERYSGKQFSVRISQDELERLKEVENVLLKSFSIPPPTIPQLAKKAAMSPTKLKKLFKAVYGNAIYEYFQKRRMQHAADLLLTKKYSVKEVGGQLGYANLSNFTLAFKKEFQRLPSEFE